jgi:hypothetical protein
VLSTLVSEWYVDVRLDNTVLVQEKFYTGYGNQDYPNESDWIFALNTHLEYLYQEGLNYFIDENNVLTVSNTTCYDEFTDKTLTVNVGVNIQINCS